MLFVSSTCLAQGAVQAVRGAADRLVEGQGKLSTGPKDPSEKVAPGPIDANASTEFKETASGLKYRILRASDKTKPKATQTVTVHYKGWLDNEKIFDSSYQRGQTISFPLSGVIKGWTEGMQLIGEGGMIELYIPYKLAYGENGRPPIPPKADLHFIVELIAIK
jgi:FKBP-type peptidyl-prolyl cis-trans isomerase FkpA